MVTPTYRYVVIFHVRPEHPFSACTPASLTSLSHTVEAVPGGVAFIDTKLATEFAAAATPE